MKANEARAISDSKTSSDLDSLYEAIKKAANLGDYKTHYYAHIRPEHQKQLEADGYKVTFIDDPRETVYCISWENQK